MKLIASLTIAAMLAGPIIATPALADPGRGNGHDRHARDHDRNKHAKRAHRDNHHRGNVHYRSDCPPGLAKKNPPCVPPGQARKGNIHYGTGIGDVLRIGDYLFIRDPSRYRLEQRRGWNYYRDDDRIYRVDSDTRKVLAVINLIRALQN